MERYFFPLPDSLEAAAALQRQARSRVIPSGDLEEGGLVGGVDVGFEENNTIARAAIAVARFPSLELVGTAIARVPTPFPYVPGFLSFREIPAILAALGALETIPDFFLCDGQGIAHPRRLGIASHLGITIDRPTIGVAKSLLVGVHEPVGEEKGDWKPLLARGETIGAVFRSRERVKPLYISIGHRVSLETALERVARCLTRYRLPEPIRIADRLSRSGASRR